jgi:hypothetical protein
MDTAIEADGGAEITTGTRLVGNLQQSGRGLPGSILVRRHPALARCQKQR